MRNTAPVVPTVLVLLGLAGVLCLAQPSTVDAQAHADGWWQGFQVPRPSPDVMTWHSIRAIATDGQGRVYVADHGLDRVLRLDEGGAVDGVWAAAPTRGLDGTAPDASLGQPLAVRPLSNGELWIGSVGGILVMDADGRFMRRISYADDEGRRIGLTDMAIAPSGERIFGTRGGADGILVFGPDGRYEATWRGIDGERLRSFGGIAFTANGQVLATDANGHRILVYDRNGEIQGSWGEQGALDGQLERPGAIAVTADGDVLVVDTGNRRIQRFGPEGEHRATWTGPAGDPDGFTAPSEIHVAQDGSIYVMDTEPQRLLRLDADGALVGEPLRPASASRFLPFATRWALAEDGSLVGHDAARGRIMRFGAGGRFQGEFATRPEDPLSASGGEGIGVTAAGEIVVPVGQEVRIFDSAGAVRRAFTRTVESDPRQGVATDLAVADDGAIIVAEPSQIYRVLAFERDGRLRWSAGGARGNTADRFERPSAVASSGDSVWITDPGARRLSRHRLVDGTLGDVVLDAWNQRCLPTWPQQGLQDVHVAADGRLLALGGQSEFGFLDDGHWQFTLGGRGVLDRPTFALLADDERRIYTNASRDVLVAFERSPGESWRLEVFENPWLTGFPSQIDELPEPSLDEGASPTRRSARLSRWLDFEQGTHAFEVTAGGGVRLWVDDVLVVDRWLADETSEQATYRSPWAARRRVVVEHRSPEGPASLALTVRPRALETPEPTVTPEPTAVATHRFEATPLPTWAPGTGAASGPHRIFLPRVLRQDGAKAREAAEAWQAIPGIDVLEYDIDLAMLDRTGEAGVQAVVTLTVQTTMPMETLPLHIEPSAVHVAHVSVGSTPVGWSVIPGTENGYGLSGSRLIVPLPSPSGTGQEQVVRIDYRIDASSFGHDRGFFLDGGGEEENALLSTRSAPYFTRYWLPSHDHPSDPAAIRFTLRVPEGMHAAANGLPIGGDFLAGSGTDASGRTVFRYARREALQTYLMRVAMGAMSVHVQPICFERTGPPELVECEAADEQIDLVYFHRGEGPLPDWPFSVTAPPGRGDLEILVYFSRLFGPYPNEKLGVLGASHPYSMEYAGLMALTSYRDNRHEFLHGWWGNSVRIHDWRDFWIKESLTTYLVSYWDERYFDLFPMRDLNPCMAGEIVPESEYDFLVEFYSGRRRAPYEKGAAAWHDFRWRLADAAGTHIWDDGAIALFEGTLAALYRDHAHDFLTTEGLHAWLRENLALRFQAAGFDSDAVDVEALVSDWSAQWALR